MKTFTKNLYLFSLLFLGLNNLSFSATYTYNQDVAPIIFNHCLNCHYDGGLGPFPLTNYSETVLEANGILDAITNNTMPPWKPDPNYRHLKDENVLSSAQKNTIESWINNGMPEGSGNPPTFEIPSNSSQLDFIDQTVSTANYSINSNDDVYRTFVIPAGNNLAKYVNKIEFLPGNNSVVHHIILFSDSTNYSYNLDQLDLEPGYQSNGTMQASAAAQYVCVWAPGAGIYELPSNMGIRIAPNSYYLIEVHYAPGSLGQSDSSLVNIQYATGSAIREVFIDPVMDWGPESLLNFPLSIPANTTALFKQRYLNTAGDASVISVFPHMHKIGTSYKVFATNTQQDTIPYLHIPNWDFHWQGFYTFQSIQKLSLGETLWGVSTFDNTSNNPDNPSSPPINVFAGEQTTDEMMVVFLAYLPYQTGDENIILDSTLFSVNVKNYESVFEYEVSPTLVTDELCISKIPINSFIQIIDVTGKIVKTLNYESAKLQVDVSEFNSGIYFVKCSNSFGVKTKKFMKK
jgi:hypothetical protein